MRYLLGVFVLLIGLSSCVPAKKYSDLVEKEQNCREELKRFKTEALEQGPQFKTLQKRVNLLETEVVQLRKDTTDLGNDYRSINAKYKQEKALHSELEGLLQDIKSSDSKQLAKLTADLEAKIIETQRKEDALMELENELNKKQALLAEREERIEELEDIIQKQKDAVSTLKDKIAAALTGFTDRGLTVEERNGKVYVSLEAKLLFASGSTAVSTEGKKAVSDLAKAIENESDLEIIVEGHTDTDHLASASHPKNNWELSVLRATAVVEIMTANSAINPSILMAAGRSEYHPVDPKDKAKNRRIEVIIAPRLDALFELISK